MGNLVCLGIVDIVLVQDVLLELGDRLVMFLLKCTVGLVFVFLVQPDQCLGVLHLHHFRFQTVTRGLDCADLAFRVFLPAFIRSVLFNKAIYIRSLSPQVEDKFGEELVNLRELLFYMLLAVKNFLTPPTYHLETPCYGIVSLLQRLLDF